MILIKISYSGKIDNRIEIPPTKIKKWFIKKIEQI
jgi:hypothetical protein|tara:strand:+ start:228 stop:332 length:105 start_codon:yes stop_codon:yes gene_type:complete